ncbi:MAG: manganese ABC transporter ATP-binding protein [Planctomycetes bacterium TMED75]|nr:manganese ABC transporter ATP-binding protein [Planctomycetaceae bacterium]OUU93561.1 MAG: manganese ABC transporter ATP-binding protein [Planctomycetes bacterium TMED75]
MTVAYHRRPVLWDVDLDIPPGSLVGIVGPNGAGKSTLIKAAIDLIPKLSGRVRFHGETYARQRRLVGYVPQRESVDWEFPVTVLEVVCMGLYDKLGWFRRVTRTTKERGMAALEQVGLSEFAHRQIANLSGGQQQRTFLARALVQEADLYLMDEPFAAVDAATEQSIIELLRKIKNSGRTALVVHHDLQTVPDYFDHVLLLNTRVVAFGPTREVFTPKNLQATYGGKLTLLEQASEALSKHGSVS